MEDPSFWEDQERAQEVITEANELKSWTLPYSFHPDAKRDFEKSHSLYLLLTSSQQMLSLE